jgi:hypothetical protein
MRASCEAGSRPKTREACTAVLVINISAPVCSRDLGLWRVEGNDRRRDLGSVTEAIHPPLAAPRSTCGILRSPQRTSANDKIPVGAAEYATMVIAVS